MSLPLTPEQEAWLQRQKAALVKAIKARRGEPGKQCRDCKFGRAHPFSDKYFYCAKFASRHTPNGMAKTKRTLTCDQFTSRQ